MIWYLNESCNHVWGFFEEICIYPFIYRPKFKRLFSPFSRFGVAFTYYGITLNITGFGLNPYLTQFIFASIEMPMKIGVYYFLEKVGRKHGQMGSMLLTGLCLFINIFVPKGNFSYISCTFSDLFLPRELIWMYAFISGGKQDQSLEIKRLVFGGCVLSPENVLYPVLLR